MMQLRLFRARHTHVLVTDMHALHSSLVRDTSKMHLPRYFLASSFRLKADRVGEMFAVLRRSLRRGGAKRKIAMPLTDLCYASARMPLMTKSARCHTSKVE